MVDHKRDESPMDPDDGMIVVWTINGVVSRYPEPSATRPADDEDEQ